MFENLIQNNRAKLFTYLRSFSWKDENRVEIETNFSDECRKILIGKISDKTWTVIFTYRKKTVRIISVRRSRKKEIILYEREDYGKNR